MNMIDKPYTILRYELLHSFEEKVALVGDEEPAFAQAGTVTKVILQFFGD